MLKLRLIRHPKPQVEAGVCYGATDLLAEEAALDAQLASCLLMPRPTLVLSSPLRRCADLARALARQGWPEPVLDAGFAEMNFGDWEMRAWSQIERQQIDAWAADISAYAPPGGESVQDVAARALQAIYRQWVVHTHVVNHLLDELGQAPSVVDVPDVPDVPSVMLICHSGVIQGLSHALSGKSWREFKPANLAYGEVRDVQVPRPPL
jgi:alpha-ribazole phosphatase